MIFLIKPLLKFAIKNTSWEERSLSNKLIFPLSNTMTRIMLIEKIAIKSEEQQADKYKTKKESFFHPNKAYSNKKK